MVSAIAYLDGYLCDICVSEDFEKFDQQMAGGRDMREWLDSRIMSEAELPEWLQGKVEARPDPEDPLTLIDAGRCLIVYLI